nr:hypothetical protein HmN_000968500 [Hymenolepis microstoma]
MYLSFRKPRRTLNSEGDTRAKWCQRKKGGPSPFSTKTPFILLQRAETLPLQRWHQLAKLLLFLLLNLQLELTLTRRSDLRLDLTRNKELYLSPGALNRATTDTTTPQLTPQTLHHHTTTTLTTTTTGLPGLDPGRARWL